MQAIALSYVELRHEIDYINISQINDSGKVIWSKFEVNAEGTKLRYPINLNDSRSLRHAIISEHVEFNM